MKLWDISLVAKPGTDGMKERIALWDFARDIGALGTTVRSARESGAEHIFVITLPHETRDGIVARWRTEHGDPAKDGSIFDACVDQVPEDVDPHVMTEYFGMDESVAREMLREAYGDRVALNEPVVIAPESVKKLDEEQRSKLARLEFRVHVNGMKELLDDMREAVALMEKLKELAGSLELVIEHE